VSLRVTLAARIRYQRGRCRRLDRSIVTVKGTNVGLRRKIVAPSAAGDSPASGHRVVRESNERLPFLALRVLEPILNSSIGAILLRRRAGQRHCTRQQQRRSGRPARRSRPAIYQFDVLTFPAHEAERSN
jgi:hypothetical protein